MKSIYLTLIITIISISVISAQTNIPKGSLLLGGDISFGTTHYEDINSRTSNSYGFNISPSIGVAIKENLFAGLSLGVGLVKNAFNNGPYIDSSKLNTYSYGVFIRKYKPLKNNFNIFLQGNLYGFNAKKEYYSLSSNTESQKDLGLGFSLTPGISYAINSKLQLEAGLNSILGIGYGQSRYSDNLSSGRIVKHSTFNAYTSLNNFSSQLYFGFRLLLQKKKA